MPDAFATSDVLLAVTYLPLMTACTATLPLESMASENRSQSPAPHRLAMSALAPAFSALTYCLLTFARRFTSVVPTTVNVGGGGGVGGFRHPGTAWTLPSTTLKQLPGGSAAAATPGPDTVTATSARRPTTAAVVTRLHLLMPTP